MRAHREVWVWRSPEEFCENRDAEANGRLLLKGRSGGIDITVRRKPSDGRRVHALVARAMAQNELVGFATGYAADLNRFDDPYDFVGVMDGFDQTTYDAAEAIAALGEDFWWSRDLFLFFDKAEVKPAYRQRGIGRALVEAIVTASSKKNRRLALLLQPYPDAITHVPSNKINGRRRATAEERRVELEKTTQIWLRVFPFLRPIGKGGLENEREYFLGTVSKQ